MQAARRWPALPQICLLPGRQEEVAKARSDFGEERYEKTEFQAKVRDNYDLSDSPEADRRRPDHGQRTRSNFIK